MSEEQKAAVVAQDLAGYAPELVPGAVEHLSKLWAPLAHLSPERRAQEIASRIDSVQGERWKDPSFDGSQTHRVAAAIERQSGHLTEGSVAALTTTLSAKLASISDPGRLAAAVSKEIHAPANAQYLKNPPPVPAYVNRLDALLGDVFPEMNASGRMDLIMDRGREFRALSDAQVIMSVAGALKSSVVASKYSGGTTIPTGDLRLQGRNTSGVTRTPSPTPAPTPAPTPSPTPSPTRGGDGRFTPGSPTPTQPPRRRLGF